MPGISEPSRTINVDLLTRVEGEGALHVTVTNQHVEDVQLRIFEPPRFFEAFLQGRHVSEVPDLVARICGICPVAYQMSAVHALEPIFQLTLPETIHQLRRLLYCAEWIESHTLHIYMLQGPDFLGYASGLEMAKDHGHLVTRGLKLKKVGNDLLQLLGGRSVHPVSVMVGGFSRVPTRAEFSTFREELCWARDAAAETVRWVSTFTFDDPEHDYTYVSLHADDEYAMNRGTVRTTRGHDLSASNFERHFQEIQVPYSHALQCVLDGQSYFAGPLARLYHNYDQLSPYVKQVFADTPLSRPFRRASLGIVARALEVLYACDEAIRTIDTYTPPPTAAVPYTPQAGTGMAITEAPRGLLYHRYEVDTQGLIQQAGIVPPTSQNQRRIEDDLRHYLPDILHLPDDVVAKRCEQLVRSYDPCISCATHFLRLDINNTDAHRVKP